MIHCVTEYVMVKCVELWLIDCIPSLTKKNPFNRPLSPYLGYVESGNREISPHKIYFFQFYLYLCIGKIHVMIFDSHAKNIV